MQDNRENSTHTNAENGPPSDAGFIFILLLGIVSFALLIYAVSRFASGQWIDGMEMAGLMCLMLSGCFDPDPRNFFLFMLLPLGLQKISPATPANPKSRRLMFGLLTAGLFLIFGGLICHHLLHMNA